MSREDSNTWIYARNFDRESMAANLESILAAATEDEIQSGRRWYQEANEFAQKIAKKYDHSLEKIVGIISSLSPETKYSANIKDTIQLIEQGAAAIVTTYDNNRDKALEILGDKLDPHAHYSKAINKTAAFYFNILNPQEPGRVTVDRHSARVAHGYYLTGDEAIYYSNTPAKYKATQQVYQDVAAKHDLLPHQLQAITWLAYRRIIVPERYQYQDINLGEIIL